MAPSFSITTAIISLILLTLTYTVSRLIYNVFLHPLRRYPGPLLSHASILPMQSQTLRGRFPFWIHSLHERYGPVVRYAPDELSFISSDAVKDIYGHGRSSFEKQKVFYGKDVYGDPTGLFRADAESHARQRKLVSHAFSEKALREQESIFAKYVALLVQKLQIRAAKNEAADMVKWYNFTTFDIMADLTFGEPLGLLDGSEYTPWVASVFAHVKLNALAGAIRRWSWLESVFTRFAPKSLREKRRVHMEHSSERVDRRLEKDLERPDIWSYVVRNQGKGEGDRLEKSEMYSNSALFMLAGTETTATELSGVTYHLLKNPAKMARLTKEIRTAFSSLDDINLVNITQLEYLNACIDEGLRIYPPVAIGLPRSVPEGGAKVGGMWLPGGTAVALSQYAAYHSERNFKDPESFVPERWMPEGKEEYGSDDSHVFVPFSFGPRNCLGRNLAYHEMRFVLASVLLNFDLELADNTVWTDQNVYNLWDKKPLMIKLTPVGK
ncbi:cytochrome P450 [Periconia macrospinosa]|uniref:Cytochrome P450 n=1 Tax=Periconia macrospinosa TaxID=97972 RepID=A0A2V1DEQ9_9PLEO|nr:cytochrome P450 [Periconia macrospinosa]